MRPVLLDTHALVWAMILPDLLSDRARDRINKADTVYVSAASIYEIDSKRRDASRARSRSPGLARMPRSMPGTLPLLGYTLLDITADLAWRAANLPMAHGDPWDRILVAQAKLLQVPLISCDEALRSQAKGVTIIW
ncbi:MAG: PIN domain nuclease [Brevundimonas sp.]|nr:PIN domain nuclease [Brevundimonas sp.]